MSFADARGLPGLHLYHHDLSSCSQRVRIALHELRLPWTGHLVDLRRHEHLSPEYRGINPRALVPALVDEGRVVIESCDIMVHLDGRAGGRLGGADDPLLRAADEAQGPLKTLTHEWVFRARGAPDPDAPKHPDPDAQAFAREYAEEGDAWAARVRRDVAAMADALRAVERRLAAAAWLGGDRFGLVDIAWASTVHRLAHLGWPLSPAVAGWYARVRERPSFDAAVTALEPPGFAARQADYVARRRAEGTAIERILA